jgi:hypothetical protein
MQYLTVKRKIDPALASKILEFCGARILVLKVACDNLDRGANIDGLFTSPGTC